MAPLAADKCATLVKAPQNLLPPDTKGKKAKLFYLATRPAGSHYKPDGACIRAALEKPCGLSEFKGTASDTVFCGKWDTCL